MQLRVVVPATALDCPAARALRTEGVSFDLVLMDEPEDYGALMTELWRSGDDFCLVEHDVVPWPGALEKLGECSEAWCVHWFPFAPNAIRPALGCCKFAAGLTAALPDAPAAWEGAEWWQLDGLVYPVVAASGRQPHRHRPDFAHLKA